MGRQSVLSLTLKKKKSVIVTFSCFLLFGGFLLLIFLGGRVCVCVCDLFVFCFCSRRYIDAPLMKPLVVVVVAAVVVVVVVEGMWWW